MKILFFSNTDWSLYNFRIPLARELRKKGHQIVMVSSHGKYVKLIEKEGFRHVKLNITRTGINPIHESKTIISLIKILKKEKPTITHNFTPKGVLYGSITAKLTGVPVIVNSITGLGLVYEDIRQGLKYKFLRRLLSIWYKISLKNTSVIFQNENDKNYFLNRNIVKENSAYLIKSSGVSLDQFYTTDNRNKIPIISLAARMVKSKGIETFVEAATIIKSEGIKSRFVLAGFIDKSREDAINENTLLEWENKGLIEWWGFQNNISKFYSQTDIVCLPSFGKEGVPRTLIEAAAAGKPIITTDNPGCSDSVINGVTGIIVPIGDSKALAEAIKKLILDEDKRKEMGERSRQYSKEFSIERVARHTENIYSRAYHELVKH